MYVFMFYRFWNSKSFKILYYYNTHLICLDPDAVPEETVDSNDKRQICHHITSSDFFTSHLRETVYVHEIYDELQLDYQEVFNQLYEKSNTVVIAENGDDMVYTNRTKLIIVTSEYAEKTTRGLPEFAFICLARNGETSGSRNAIFQYLVSREYNVSELPNRFVAARFVFEYLDNDPSSDEIRIFAVAEEPASILSSLNDSNAERIYLERRTQNAPGKLSTLRI